MLRFNRIQTLWLGCLLLLWAVPASGQTVIDQFGRQIQVPDQPRRIVAMAPSITEIVFALGLSDRLVGATQYSDYPPAAQSLPKVGSYVHLDVEKIVSLRPDLCIAVKDGNPLAAVTKLESVGVPVYAVDPRNLDAVIKTLHELGQLLDAGATAERVATSMADRIAHVKARIACADRIFHLRRNAGEFHRVVRRDRWSLGLESSCGIASSPAGDRAVRPRIRRSMPTNSGRWGSSHPVSAVTRWETNW